MPVRVVLDDAAATWTATSSPPALDRDPWTAVFVKPWADGATGRIGRMRTMQRPLATR